MLLILLYVTVLFKENAVFYDWQVHPKSIFTAFTPSASRYLTEAIIHTGAVIWIPVLPFFFSISGGLSFVLAQPGSCIPRALVDSRSPNLVLTVEKKWLQIPGLSANDNTVTGPQQRFNAYQRVRLAVYKTRIPAQSLKQEFSPFFFPVVLLQMFPNFLSFSPSLLLFCRTDLGGQRKQFSASWTS